MRALTRLLRPLAADTRGVTMLEYAIMGSIIAAALIIGAPLMTKAVHGSFTGMASHVGVHT